MVNLALSSWWAPGHGVALWRYFGAELDTIPLIFLFLIFFAAERAKPGESTARCASGSETRIALPFPLFLRPRFSQDNKNMLLTPKPVLSDVRFPPADHGFATRVERCTSKSGLRRRIEWSSAPDACSTSKPARPSTTRRSLSKATRSCASARLRREIRASTQVIDLPNATVLPGLIDCHTHLTFDPKSLGYESLGISVPREALTGAKNARITLEAGFTTVRNVGASGYSDVALRDAINDGDVPGPRMLVSGAALGITGGHCDDNLLPREYHASRTAWPTAWKPFNTKFAR